MSNATSAEALRRRIAELDSAIADAEDLEESTKRLKQRRAAVLKQLAAQTDLADQNRRSRGTR